MWVLYTFLLYPMEKKIFFSLIVFFFFSSLNVFAQSKGKISGFVKDKQGEPLPGVQIIIEGTTKGVLAELDGFYSILNLSPGTYTLLYKYIGFADVRVEEIEVLIDRTTEINVEMKEAVIEGEEVVVTAQRPVVEKDRTTTTSFVSSQEIAELPIESVAEVVNLQAGVVDGHFRGGRLGEVAYVVNGVPINNAYTNGAGFEIEQNMVSSLEVISGVFNAEYGQALSGVVNIVTKDVPREWSFNNQSYIRSIVSSQELIMLKRDVGPGSNLAANDFSTEKLTYFDVAGIPNQIDVQFNAGGPIIAEKLGIQLTGRYVRDNGVRFGRDLFSPRDSSINVNSTDNSQLWGIESTGSGDFVPLTNSERFSINGSVVYNLTSTTKIDYNLFLQADESNYFTHNRKYVPGGRNTNFNNNQTHILGLRKSFSAKTFANLSYSYLNSDFESKLYDNILDSRLGTPLLGNQTGLFAFSIGGNDLSYSNNRTQTHTIVASVTSQINRVHQIKAGFQTRFHKIKSTDYDIIVDSDNGFVPRISTNENPSFGFSEFEITPSEFSAYLQDKIELDFMTINVGLRYDLFDPDYLIPRFWYLADEEIIPSTTNSADSVSNRKSATLKSQLSPRIGLAFPISETGVVRFSYGLFFQIPSLGGVYSNPEYFVDDGGSGTFGNPDIEPQQTSTFEIGIQQGLTNDIGIDVTLFTKDIRNLTAQIIEFNPEGAGTIRRQENRDYGTVRGVTLSLYQRPVGKVRWNLDYTLQFADGSAFLSGDSFERQRAGLEDVNTLARLDWDRRHVLNSVLTFNVNKDLNFTFVNRLNVGRPYTTQRSRITSYIPRDGTRPTTLLSDIRLYYKLPIKGAQLILQGQNLFDAKAPQTVFSDSGNAEYTIQQFDASTTGTVGGLNTLDDWFTHPEYYSAPRRISLGLNINF